MGVFRRDCEAVADPRPAKTRRLLRQVARTADDRTVGTRLDARRPPWLGTRSHGTTQLVPNGSSV